MRSPLTTISTPANFSVSAAFRGDSLPRAFDSLEGSDPGYWNKMKSIHPVIILVFSITSIPQDDAQYTTAQDLIVINSKLSSIVHVDVTRSDPPPSDKSRGCCRHLPSGKNTGL